MRHSPTTTSGDARTGAPTVAAFTKQISDQKTLKRQVIIGFKRFFLLLLLLLLLLTLWLVATS